MKDVLGIVRDLRRPRLLVRAAKAGVLDYKRDPHLHRLFGHANLPRPGAALMKLIEMESELDDLRLADDAAYRVARHVEVLIAVMGEAQVLREATAC
ncbi:MAG: DUF6477 family protein [Pelagimonas sp.]|nr:DUF6477 family protein [Pelagimonas sp.]